MLKPHETIPVINFEPGKLIVQFKPEATEDLSRHAHEAAGAKILGQIPALHAHVVAVEVGKEIELIDRYLALEHVANVEPNYYRYPVYRPNDRFYSERIQTSDGVQRQWGLRRINPEGAWDAAHELTPTVKVAIIDSGIDPDHPDLAGKIVNPTNLYKSNTSNYIDQCGHGTMVAGIIAAVTNNETGIAGTSFNVANIMPIRAGNQSFTTVEIINAIKYAIENGANIIQMSFGHEYYSHFEQEMINEAWDKGIVLIASAGNSGNELVNYPAGYLHVLSVSATDMANELAPFSSWGTSVGVCAPGVSILSTAPTYPATDTEYLKYDAASGTSFSAPFVAGVAAMLMAVNPMLTNQEVVQTIQRSTRALANDPFDDPLDDPAKDTKVVLQKNVPEDSQKSPCSQVAEDPCDGVSLTAGGRGWSPFFGYGILDASVAVRLATVCPWKEEGLGSFYGQVVSKLTGKPLARVVVCAVKDGEILREYATKINIIDMCSGAMNNDGMFRLMNLPNGTYDIIVYLPEPEQAYVKVLTAKIVPGADVLLKLVI